MPLVVGVLVFIVTVTGVVAAVRVGSASVYFTSAAIAGLSSGVIATAGNRLLLPTARPDQRAGLLSTIFHRHPPDGLSAAQSVGIRTVG